MNQEDKIPGVETIRGLVGEPPKEIGLTYDLVHTQEVLRQAWNSNYIAIIPYCFKCREPLVWHIPPTKVIFHCPKCNRKWTKNRKWEKEKHD